MDAKKSKLEGVVGGEVKREVRNADGTAVQIRFGVWRCLICGETILALEAPSHCPFCGAHREYISDDPSAFDPSVNDVAAELTELEKKNLEESMRTELAGANAYAAMAKAEGTPKSERAPFKRLIRIEQEHLGVFSKLLGAKKPNTIADPNGTWKDDVKASIAREENAHVSYARFAREAKNARLKQVWTAFAEVELDHVVLENEMLDALHK